MTQMCAMMDMMCMCPMCMFRYAHSRVSSECVKGSK